MLRGTVNTWFEDRGYGFVSRDDAGGNVFLHISQMPDKQPPRVGDRVSFDVGVDPRSGKHRAIDVLILTP
jgi:CspA family cold shock protein